MVIEINSLSQWQKLGFYVAQTNENLVLSQSYQEWLKEHPEGCQAETL